MNSITPEVLILLIIEANGGRLRGKTLLQKRSYFLCERLDCFAGFRPHYFGPYSPTIDLAIGRLKSVSLVEEHAEGFGRTDSVGFEWRRYEYVLTQDGRKVIREFELRDPDSVRQIRDYLQEMERAGDNGDYVNLSIAAKTFFILKNENKELSTEEIQIAAKRLGWEIQPKQIDAAATFLQRLDLISTEPIS